MTRAWGLVMVVGALGCGADEAVLLVDLRTDFAAGIEFVATRAEVLDGSDRVILSMDRPSFATADFRSGARVAELEGLAEGEYSVRLLLLTGAGDTIAEQRSRVAVRGRVVVTIVIARGCIGSECPDCTSDAECVPAATCARGACTDGTCLYFPIEGACGMGLYCNPDEGCSVMPNMDAGIPLDAASPDASPASCPVCADDQICDEATLMCVPCGRHDEICCSDDTCLVADRVCTGGLCRDCGGPGQPCCSRDTCDGTSLVCSPMTICIRCGGIGERCCPGLTCNEGTCLAGYCRT